MYLTAIFSTILIILVNLILIKNDKLLNFSGERHQNFFKEKKIPLSGGIILFFNSFFFLNLEVATTLIISSIFFIGFLSDLKFFKSPKIRILLQIFFLIFIIKFVDVYLVNTRISFLDQLLQFDIFNIFYTCFCLLIIINGSNFIDGVNNSVLGYYVIISLILLFFENSGVLLISLANIELLLIVLLILLIFNFLNKLYLGDSGSCQLGLIFSIILIKVYLENQFISPFFIINLLWYPAFENLFSILRKISFSRSPIKADTNHLHHLIYLKFKNLKVFSKKHYINNFTGMTLNIYNMVVLIFAAFFLTNTKLQIMLIILNIFIYMFIYRKLIVSKKLRR